MNGRHKMILELLEKQGEIAIPRLAQLLNVSEMTVHRDLDFLQERGLLGKKRGAAFFVETKKSDMADFYRREKLAIAKAAAGLVKPGDSLLLDNSTTALETAKQLDGISGLTVYTTNLEAARIVSEFDGVILYCSGGFYYRESTGFVGSITEKFVDSLRVDKCIIGTSGITGGKITIPYPMHAVLQKKIIDASKCSIVVADHSKFGRSAVETVAGIDDIDYIVTDSEVDRHLISDIAEKVIIAEIE